MHRLVVGGAVLALLVAGGPPVAAQQRMGSNPHGPLPRGLDCSACHAAAAWSPLRSPLPFDHAKATGFALTGRHAAASCARCHTDLRFDQPESGATACAGCHADVHQGRIAGDCARCHSTTTFRDVPAVSLHARAGFPLSGAHLQTPCQSCHRDDRGGAFAPLPADCLSCHREDYQKATVPDHAGAGFPTDCQQCHATLTWTGGVAFDHARAARGYSLVGAHALLRCADCHVSPGLSVKFTPSSQNDCLACHAAVYQRAHGTAGFPTTCADCHSQDRWGGANFDHSQWFPLRGPHDVSCSRCHTTQGDFSAFDCLGCHGQGPTNARHGELAGYAYESGACYRCHARGRAEGG